MLKSLIVAMALAASPAVAFAGKNDANWNPPSRFDHSFRGELIERRIPQKQVVAACRKLFLKYGIHATASDTQRGCAAIASPRRCIIVYVDKTFMGAKPSAVRRHEIGHCNGWTADHSE